jgi:hypothetical protein
MRLFLFLLMLFLLFLPASFAKEKARPGSAGKEIAGPPAPEEKATGRNQKRLSSDDKKDPKKTDKSETGTCHRVEFVITGTECPVCIERMTGKMRKVPGVKKAAIFRFSVTNYGAVIYDAKVAQWKDIMASVDDEHVGFDGVKDTILSKEEFDRLTAPGSASK